ncbi:hypothetical protein JMM81_08345 [Bacillus sp. V3B]|uniref:hypothetical protein n=1 Tax=Bacillus sp. V3B TaxID=2804915 RepID=UPI00210E885E|nr:hypothetical protein [Bacillus sp. V3B]MCQ6274969.1 hypothetical protein [Bacillus sp. V3B]
MFIRNSMFMKSRMFKWMPHREQHICERKLIKIMKRLKIEEYHFNWDRSSCFIEFQYEETSYRMEHSVQKAKEKGVIVLRNGLDCLMELVQSLEDLCQIIERGTYRLETWVSGMKQSSPVEDAPEFLEEVPIRYKSLGKQKHSEYNRNEEMIHVAPESSLEDFDRHPILQRSHSK